MPAPLSRPLWYNVFFVVDPEVAVICNDYVKVKNDFAICYKIQGHAGKHLATLDDGSDYTWNTEEYVTTTILGG